MTSDGFFMPLDLKVRSAPIIFSAILCAAQAVWAQNPPAPLQFEAASVRPSGPDALFTMGPYPGGRFRATAITPILLIGAAYRLQVIGAPGWTNTAKYDIEASAGRSIDRDEMREMLRSLLADRFKLAAHKEERESTVLSLTVAKGGPKLETTEEKKGVRSGVDWDEEGIFGERASMAQLAEMLGRTLSRPVTDETGLSGRYNFKLHVDRQGARAAGEEPHASIFTTIQEQLGLKLVAKKAKSEVLVIDHIERPGEN